MNDPAHPDPAHQESAHRDSAHRDSARQDPARQEKAPEYLASRIHERLAADPHIAELGIRVTVRSGWLLVSGVVATPERRDEILRIVREEAPGIDVRSDVTVAEAAEPTGEEILS